MRRVQDTDPNEAPGGTASSGSSTGWTPQPDHQRRRWPLLIGLLLVGVVFIAGPLAVAFMFEQSRSSGPNMQSVGFGTSGSGCTLTNSGSSFPVGVPIRVVLTLSPALPTGGTVRFKIDRNGAELVDLRETITVEELAPCIHGTLPPLEVGHYRVEYAISPSMTAPISSEFDVIPADVASALPTVGAASQPPKLVALGEAVVIVDERGAELGTAAVIEAKEPAPGEVVGFVAAAENRLIVVKVRYTASAQWEINMFDWALRDATGRQYDPTGFGPEPVLVTRSVAPGQTFEGWMGFEVPRSAGLWIDMRAVDQTTIFSVELERGASAEIVSRGTRHEAAPLGTRSSTPAHQLDLARLAQSE
jgi:hypothetical protein